MRPPTGAPPSARSPNGILVKEEGQFGHGCGRLRAQAPAAQLVSWRPQRDSNPFADRKYPRKSLVLSAPHAGLMPFLSGHARRLRRVMGTTRPVGSPALAWNCARLATAAGRSVADVML